MKNLHVFPVGPIDTNCYLLEGENREAIVIDPGADGGMIADELDEMGLRLVAVLATHGHMDHLTGLAELTERHPAPLYLHPADAAWAFTLKNTLVPYFMLPPKKPAEVRPVADGDVLNLAGLAARVIATPGHTPGGVCYYFEGSGHLFSGDTLFQGNVGRTDLPGSDPRAMTRSIARLAELPDGVRVHPGHGDDTTIEEEKRSNYFMARAANHKEHA